MTEKQRVLDTLTQALAQDDPTLRVLCRIAVGLLPEMPQSPENLALFDAVLSYLEVPVPRM